MSEPDAWDRANERYLSAALRWLRLKLDRFARVDQGNDDELAEPATAMRAAEGGDVPPALVILAERFGLSRFERDVLLLAVAMELDTRIAGLCAQAQDDARRPYPTFALALALFDDPAWEVLSPHRPLRHWRLLEVDQAGLQPVTALPLRADERIVAFVKGLNQIDAALVPFLSPLEPANGRMDVPPSQVAAVERAIAALQAGDVGNDLPLVNLVGPDASSRQLVAACAAAALGLVAYRLAAEMLPGDMKEMETLVRLWGREGILLPVALYVDAGERESDWTPPGAVAHLPRFIDRVQGVVLLATAEVHGVAARPAVVVDVAKPTAPEQHAAWSAALGTADPAVAGVLAGQFDLSLADIGDVGRRVSGDVSLAEAAWQAVLSVTRPRLSGLARRLEPKATWDDIVLPDEERSLLRAVADQVRHRMHVYEEWGFAARTSRGLGISALFAGESGTGKTMAAEVVANHLRLDLYRIDLSAVVSKYIGETEKNLRRLFDAAEAGGAILFFDEADALFGKRSEVKDSHDRYANIEINYLLQRMESYRGLAVLATNVKSALDQAFLRRLRFVINFPFPGFAERRAIWERAFPPEAPVEDLDLDRLARLNLSGGSIHNIALASAFLATGAATAITMPLVLDAARTEVRKLERPVNEADFRLPAPQAVTG